MTDVGPVGGDTVGLPLDAPLPTTARRLHREAPWDET
ncbi:hypothetical protein J2S46_001256 [Kitasatospora herbaricolor]|nr:hypothetical protein [Kitasatospora herbaricolor]